MDYALWTAYKNRTRNYELAIAQGLVIKREILMVFKKNLYEDHDKINIADQHKTMDVASNTNIFLAHHSILSPQSLWVQKQIQSP